MNRRNFLLSAGVASAGLVFPNPQPPDAEILDSLRRNIVAYYRNEVNPRNGLIADKSQPGSASSIAAVGMGLSVYIVAVERGIISRAEHMGRFFKNGDVVPASGMYAALHLTPHKTG